MADFAAMPHYERVLYLESNPLVWVLDFRRLEGTPL